jgi:hypothetical protein
MRRMWRKKRQSTGMASENTQPVRLKEAIRQSRIELAERSNVVVELRDAELARLELLNEALDPLFKDIPPGIELFDRGISHGETPRLWIDAIAHVVMGRDKRRYRFVQDTHYGRKVLAESANIGEMAEAITHYVASRMIERERALAGDVGPMSEKLRQGLLTNRRQRRWRVVRMFLLGLVVGGIAVFAVLRVVASLLA